MISPRGVTPCRCSYFGKGLGFAGLIALLGASALAVYSLAPSPSSPSSFRAPADDGSVAFNPVTHAFTPSGLLLARPAARARSFPAVGFLDKEKADILESGMIGIGSKVNELDKVGTAPDLFSDALGQSPKLSKSKVLEFKAMLEANEHPLSFDNGAEWVDRLSDVTDDGLSKYTAQFQELKDILQEKGLPLSYSSRAEMLTQLERAMEMDAMASDHRSHATGQNPKLSKSKILELKAMLEEKGHPLSYDSKTERVNRLSEATAAEISRYVVQLQEWKDILKEKGLSLSYSSKAELVARLESALEVDAMAPDHPSHATGQNPKVSESKVLELKAMLEEKGHPLSYDSKAERINRLSEATAEEISRYVVELQEWKDILKEKGLSLSYDSKAELVARLEGALGVDEMTANLRSDEVDQNQVFAKLKFLELKDMLEEKGHPLSYDNEAERVNRLSEATAEEISRYTVQLQEWNDLLKEKGLPLSYGSKAELVARLETAMEMDEMPRAKTNHNNNQEVTRDTLDKRVAEVTVSG